MRMKMRHTSLLLLACLAASRVWGEEQPVPGPAERDAPAPAEQVEEGGEKLPGNCPAIKGVFHCQYWHHDLQEYGGGHYQVFEYGITEDGEATYYGLTKYFEGKENEKRKSLMIADGENYGSEEQPQITQCKDGGVHLYIGTEMKEIRASWTPRDDGTILKKVFKKFKDDDWIDGGVVEEDVEYSCERVDTKDTAALADKALKELAAGPKVPQTCSG